MFVGFFLSVFTVLSYYFEYDAQTFVVHINIWSDSRMKSRPQAQQSYSLPLRHGGSNTSVCSVIINSV